MRYRIPLLAIFFLFLGCADANQEEPGSLNDQAVSKLSSATTEDDLKEALLLTEQAIDIDQKHVPAHQIRLNILLELGHYEDAQEQARTLVAINPTAESRLMVCMIQEVSSVSRDSTTECYKDLKSRIADDDPDFRRNETYLMALKLSESKEFEEAAKRHIQAMPPGPSQDIARFTFIESSREELLDQILYRNPEPSTR